MIARVTGTLCHLSLASVIVDVSGIGYRVHVTGGTVEALSQSIDLPVSLWTHHVVREDASDLYGFMSLDDLEVFNHLLSVSGIGPKSALGILNAADADTLREAISTENASYLTKTSGIGKKTAEKIVLELKDKVGMQRRPDTTTTGGQTQRNDSGALVIDALISLGYAGADVRAIMKDLDRNATTQDQLKHALKLLSNQ